MCCFSCWFVDLASLFCFRAMWIDGVEMERFAYTTQAQERLSMPSAFPSRSYSSLTRHYSITTSWSSRRSWIGWDMPSTEV